MTPGTRSAPPRPISPETRPRGTWRKAALVVLAGFVAGYVLIWLAFFPGFGRGAIVTVPDLRGQPYAVAKRRAAKLGLSVVRGRALPNPRIAAGRVLTQQPLPGQEATRGAALNLVMSAGPVVRRVPEVASLGPRGARALLERYGFSVRTVSARNEAEEGTILAVRPAAGTNVALPAAVELTLSAGPPKVLAPRVVGVTLGEVESRLAAAGLRLGRVSYDPAAGGVLGSIARQSPAPGDSIRRGGAVSVTIYGNPPVTAPPPLADSAGAASPSPAQSPPPAPQT